VPDGAFENLTSIGGSADFEGATVPDGAFENLTSIGGYADFEGATVPDYLRRVKANDPECTAGKTAKENLFKSFLKAGFVFADGILSKLISRRESNGTIIWKVVVCGKIESSFVIEKDGVYSHGETLKEAKASLIFKLTDHDTSKYKSWGLDTAISSAEAIQSYRAITGACEFGVRDFCEKKGVDFNADWTPAKILQLTEGAYGHSTYDDFFKNAKGQAA